MFKQEVDWFHHFPALFSQIDFCTSFMQFRAKTVNEGNVLNIFFLFLHYLFRCLCYVNFFSFCLVLMRECYSYYNIMPGALNVESQKLDYLIDQLKQVGGYLRPESSQC